MESINSYDAFRYQWYSWRALGIHPFQKYQIFYGIYSIILNISVTFCYPLSLVINLFVLKDLKSILENLVINLTDVVCSLKLVNIAIKRKELLKIKQHIAKLDERIKSQAEKTILNVMVKVAHRFFYLFCIVDYATVVSGGIAVLIVSKHRLIYPAWFPFDWNKSYTNYLIAYFYQFLGLLVQAAQQIAHDTFPPLYLYILTGHLEVITIRLGRLGYDAKKSHEDNYKELIECIKDYSETIQYGKILQNCLSFAVFGQVIATTMGLCIGAIYILFTDNEISELVYLCFYLLAITMEIALVCYYGSVFSQRNSDMTTSVYNCNWMDQSPKFRKAIIIFMQRTQRESALMASNWIPVNLPTFLLILKSAYSWFAVLNTMKLKLR